MDELIAVLREQRPDIDFATQKSLIDDEVLDSFDIISVIALVSEHYGVTIPPEEIIPENFNSAESLYALILSLLKNE
ncbi:MAG: acyl carrier protein [Clostridiales Family XIII bacterium]|jgi:acyl carrier protein|nr:acyl carrier protein [Clostridiales Family XIII bacterium]